MELDAFTCRLGDGQGRVVAPDGAVSFVLGDAETGRVWDLAIGDHVEVAQTLDLTGVALVRASVSLRVPTGLPPGLIWRVSVIVDGLKRASLRCGDGRTRTSSDLAANVSKLTGIHSVGVRLELAGE